MKHLFGLLWLLAACTSANPGFVGGDDGSSPTTDLGRGDRAIPASDVARPGEGGSPIREGGGPANDATPAPDVALPPDGPPPACTKDSDCDDDIPCTSDRCQQGSCASSLDPGVCLIDSGCHPAGPHPKDPCRRCAPAIEPRAWSPAVEGTPCAEDGEPCTADVCQQGACAHVLAPGWCRINGGCVPDGYPEGGGCKACDSTQSTSGWSPVADGKACQKDGKWCTQDVCQAGACVHPVVSGCLINDTCVAEGQPSGACSECVPSASTTSYTFVAGKPCASTQLGAGSFCAAGKCRGFDESSVKAPVDGGEGSSLAAVALVPAGAKHEVWAGGHYSYFTDGGDVAQAGLLARLDKPDTLLTYSPIHALHHRLAVGAGEIWHRASNGWVEAVQLSGQIKGQRLAVWGARLAGQVDVHYLVGAVKPPESVAVYRCESLFSGFSCASNYTGFNDGVPLTGVFGSRAKSGGQGPVWTITGSGPEDIYFNNGAALSWSQGVAQGCQDYGNGGSTPCSATAGDFTDIYASSAGDVWVVGDNDIVLGFDGAKWTRHWPDSQSFTQYAITAVFSSPADDLVSLAGYRDTGQGRVVALFNYNRKLKRWMPPVVLGLFFGGAEARIRDIAGTSYQDLWLVGEAPSGFGVTSAAEGWVLRLQ